MHAWWLEVWNFGTNYWTALANFSRSLERCNVSGPFKQGCSMRAIRLHLRSLDSRTAACCSQDGSKITHGIWTLNVPAHINTKTDVGTSGGTMVDFEKKLLARWKELEELESRLGADSSNEELYLNSKERWFAHAAPFLRDLPVEEHCWCKHQRITEPFLEVFSNYTKELDPSSAVIYLWKRISKELRRCTRCIKLHHQGQAFFRDEYEADAVLHIMDVVETLDKERVVAHLKDLAVKVKDGTESADSDLSEFVCIFYEVLMFPHLLEDQEVDRLFKPVLQFVVVTHELSLAASERYPGLYALLFHEEQGIRAIANRYTDQLEKFRDVADLESIQRVLERPMECLERDLFEDERQVVGTLKNAGNSRMMDDLKSGRRKTVLKREAVWKGLYKLLSLLEPPAFEEGVVERYPAFVSMVLNNVSDVTSTFLCPLRCLQKLLEVLGYKLWLSSPFSAGVMRNTLLSQCFHSRDEILHTNIFAVFQPFLQSLEGLQDGEHEKQRRRLIYFLLQQVPSSSNFSPLIRRTAAKIAFAVIGRGYMTEPPSPPLECGHVWGPALITALKDISLHAALRQPAIDLMQSIIMADVAALDELSSKQTPSSSPWKGLLDDGCFDDEDAEPTIETEQSNDDKLWRSLEKLNSAVRDAANTWFCLPLVWMEGLKSLPPASVPASFSKFVVWAASQLSLFSIETQEAQADLLVLHNGIAFSHGFGVALCWPAPKGCDDGDDGKPCSNSVKVIDHQTDVSHALKRSVAAFCSLLYVERRFERWAWEPRMTEPTILMLLDTISELRNFARDLLRHFAKVVHQDFEELLFCTSQPAVMAASKGLLHASKLLAVWPFPTCCQGMQLLFFHAEKIVTSCQKHGKKIECEMFCQILSTYLWPLICKCLIDGKLHVSDEKHQITFIRMMDVLPLVCKHLPNTLKRQVFGQIEANCRANADSATGKNFFDWFRHLVDWSDVPSLSIRRRWKQALGSLVALFMDKVLPVSNELVEVVQRLRDSEVHVDEDCRQRLSILLVSAGDLRPMASDIIPSYNLQWPGRATPALSKESPREAVSAEPAFVGDDDTQKLETPSVLVRHSSETPVLVSTDKLPRNEARSDTGDGEYRTSPVILENNLTYMGLTDNKKPTAEKQQSFARPSVRRIPDSVANRVKTNTTLDSFVIRNGSGQAFNAQAFSAKESSPQTTPLSLKSASSSKSFRSNTSKSTSKLAAIRAEVRSDKEHLAAVEHVVRSQVKERVQREKAIEPTSATPDAALSHKGAQKPRDADPVDLRRDTNRVLEDLVRDVDIDPLEMALDNARKVPSKVVLESVVLPRRRVVCLEAPGEQHRPAHGRMQSGSLSRPPPPKLDDWYRRILELNYFSVVGISTETDDMSTSGEPLTKVPTTFRSEIQYLEVFRPLLMEEFKAQLQRAYEEMSLSDGMTTGCLTLMSLERIDDFQRAQFIAEAGADGAARACSENDLILLTKKPFSKDAQNFHILAKVDKRDRDKVNKAAITLVLKIYVNQGNARLAKAKRLLIDRSRWNMTRLLNITPQLREFQGLAAVVNYPLLSTILCPSGDQLGMARGGTSTEGHSQLQNLNVLPEQLFARLSKEFNERQLHAISAAMGRKGDHQLALVQGPPGTGKTRTIMAIVSSLLALSHVKGESKYCSSVGDAATFQRPSPRVRSVSESAAIARSWQDARVAKDLMMQASSTSGLRKKERILICAQSNAAVDELVSRIRVCGLYGIDGQFYKPNLVRVGNASSVHPNSMDVFIDTLINQRFGDSKISSDGQEKDQANLLRAKLEQISELVEACEARLSQCNDSAAERDAEAGTSDQNVAEDQDEIATMGEKAIKLLSREDVEIKLRSLKKKKHKLYGEIREAQMREKKTYEENRVKRDALRKEILTQAEVVVTTLNGCGGDVYSTCMESVAGSKKKPGPDCFFTAVVVDEAAQALEPATLIPLQLLAHQQSRCVMVGDPKQLPATVLSQKASKMAFECSMFERLQQAGCRVTLLSMQYRMHPEIRTFPSEHFYNNQLVDGATLTAGSRKATFHSHWCFKPYLFFDVVDGRERGSGSAGQSLANDAEADAALDLYRSLVQRFPKESFSGKVGVITPYKQQLAVLRERFKRSLGQNIATEIDFNTVDGFQGREVDILILSTVRAASGTGGIGFVADVRRMNVALTRARFSLWIVGNAAMLQSNPSWASLISNARSRGVIHTISRPYMPFFSAASPAIGSSPGVKFDQGHEVHIVAASAGTGSKMSILTSVDGREPRHKKPRSNRSESTRSGEYGAERKRSQFSDYPVGELDQLRADGPSPIEESKRIASANDQGSKNFSGQHASCGKGRADNKDGSLFQDPGASGGQSLKGAVSNDAGGEQYGSRKERSRVVHGNISPRGHSSRFDHTQRCESGRHDDGRRAQLRESQRLGDNRKRHIDRRQEVGSLHNREPHRNPATGDEGPLDTIRKYGSCGTSRDKSGGSHTQRGGEQIDVTLQQPRTRAPQSDRHVSGRVAVNQPAATSPHQGGKCVSTFDGASPMGPPAVTRGLQPVKRGSQVMGDAGRETSRSTRGDRIEDKIASRKKQRAEAEAIMQAGLISSSGSARSSSGVGELQRRRQQVRDGRQLRTELKNGAGPGQGLSGGPSRGQERQGDPGEEEKRSSVDDILSGLGRLSASQVKGGRL